MSTYQPSNRSARWHRLHLRASIEMARWNRGVDEYLIDSLTDPSKRGRLWLSDHFEYLAQVTRERDHDDEQDDDTLRWFVWMIAPGGIRVRVRIVVNARRNVIFNAFPDRRR